jgi:hypothetical protein
VERCPNRSDWRCELAELLREQGEPAQSLQQVRRVLQQTPDDPRARELHAALVREQALGR